jgi:hypothetical protein
VTELEQQRVKTLGGLTGVTVEVERIPECRAFDVSEMRASLRGLFADLARSYGLTVLSVEQAAKVAHRPLLLFTPSVYAMTGTDAGGKACLAGFLIHWDLTLSQLVALWDDPTCVTHAGTWNIRGFDVVRSSGDVLPCLGSALDTALRALTEDIALARASQRPSTMR